MDFDQYQAATQTTAIYREKIVSSHWLQYAGLKLAGEAGEVSQHIGKMMRDDKSELTEERRVKIAEELGDVLWYVAQVADLIDFNLGSVASMNLAKLQGRADRGVLSGSGDDR